ncbi:hypothetical protein FQA39_LY00235 [Lamprigera yunnana]|nr:hypothetical protein FQA39_LY00235 [Lamprigera yunnana]
MIALIVLLMLFLVWWLRKPKEVTLTAPGPKPLPILGSLHLLGNHESPFQAFTALSKIYGNVFSITLGSTPCVVVNNFKLIREVLITKGAEFGGRPNFMRFHKLFGGDRNNSLALCDWSSLQKTRRSIARIYCAPKFTSLQYDDVNKVGCEAVEILISELQKEPMGQPVHAKPLILAACANMFTQYMCSINFDYKDLEFRKIVRYFDEIFWEINQGYAVDFLPWLLPFYYGHMKKISDWASEIRKFILSRIIDQHRASLEMGVPPRDFTDALLLHLEEDPNMNWQHIIFELEDFLGGHSAVGNLVMVTLVAIVKYPEIAKRIQAEADLVTAGTRYPNLFDRNAMPFTEATLWETLRTASSPIVPHVATTDTEIDGYTVKKGTMVFVNNYELNVGPDYWTQPEEFKPERFISVDGSVVKPSHFIPFSTGKRTCIGQRLVQCFSFLIISTLLQHYDISTTDNCELKPSCMAVPPECFRLVFTPRKIK